MATGQNSFTSPQVTVGNNRPPLSHRPPLSQTLITSYVTGYTPKASTQRTITDYFSVTSKEMFVGKGSRILLFLVSGVSKKSIHSWETKL